MKAATLRKTVGKATERRVQHPQFIARGAGPRAGPCGCRPRARRRARAGGRAPPSPARRIRAGREIDATLVEGAVEIEGHRRARASSSRRRRSACCPAGFRRRRASKTYSGESADAARFQDLAAWPLIDGGDACRPAGAVAPRRTLRRPRPRRALADLRHAPGAQEEQVELLRPSSSGSEMMCRSPARRGRADRASHRPRTRGLDRRHARDLRRAGRATAVGRALHIAEDIGEAVCCS